MIVFRNGVYNFNNLIKFGDPDEAGFNGATTTSRGIYQMSTSSSVATIFANYQISGDTSTGTAHFSYQILTSLNVTVTQA